MLEYEKYLEKENRAALKTHALVIGGQWHQKGQMGWFACSDETNDSIAAYYDFFWVYIKYSARWYFVNIGWLSYLKEFIMSEKIIILHHIASDNNLDALKRQGLQLCKEKELKWTSNADAPQ